MLFGYFGIDDLRLLAFPLTILLGHIGHDFARVRSCPDRILDARRSVRKNSELIIRGAATAKTDGHEQYRPPHTIIPPGISRHKFKTLAQPSERSVIRNGHRSGSGGMSRRTSVMAGARELNFRLGDHGGSDGGRTPDLRRAGPTLLPTELLPPGRVAELNTDHRRVKAAPEKPRSHGQISRFARSARPLEPVIGRFPRTGIEKTHIFRQ